MQVAQSTAVWKQRLVVTSAVLSDAVVQTLLTAGAAAVVCQAKAADASAIPEIAAFFDDFYSALFGKSVTVQAAVRAAGMLCLVILLLQRYFTCCAPPIVPYKSVSTATLTVVRVASKYLKSALSCFEPTHMCLLAVAYIVS